MSDLRLRPCTDEDLASEFFGRFDRIQRILDVVTLALDVIPGTPEGAIPSEMIEGIESWGQSVLQGRCIADITFDDVHQGILRKIADVFGPRPADGVYFASIPGEDIRQGGSDGTGGPRNDDSFHDFVVVPFIT